MITAPYCGRFDCNFAQYPGLEISHSPITSKSMLLMTSVTFFSWVTSLLGPFKLSPNHSTFQLPTSKVVSVPIFGTWAITDRVKNNKKQPTNPRSNRIPLPTLNSFDRTPNATCCARYPKSECSTIASNSICGRPFGWPCLPRP